MKPRKTNQYWREEASLSQGDQESLKKSKNSLRYIIFFGVFLLTLIIGIAVPVVQDGIHQDSVQNGLKMTLDNAGDMDWNSSKTNLVTEHIDTVIARFDRTALDDGKLEPSEYAVIGNGNLLKALSDGDLNSLKALFDSSRYDDGYLTFSCREVGDYIYLAGQDSTEFYRSFVPGTITLEILLSLSYLVICLVSNHLIDKAFRPVIDSMITQHKFVGDVSHELKTPLAVISASTDLLMNSAKDGSDQKKWLNSIQDQTDRMSHTIKDLVTISSLESSFRLQKVEDMSTIVRDVSLSFDAVCFERGIYYTFERIDSGCMVNCNSDDARKLFEELLGNAVKYAEGNPPSITASFVRNKNKAILTITNTGCTIKEEEKNRVFDRFYRTSLMRAEGRNGSGLGLSICQSICEKNGFRISCLPEYGKQTTFEVEMNLA
ncbi:MAG TPA: hypothetical protein DEA32_01475 [Firmicutes bacterium]|nr:hypothetical protein [Bacillota bacterium]